MTTDPFDPRGAADALLAAIVDSSDDAIISKTLGGIVTSWNPAAERLFGYSRDEMLGRPISILAAPDRVSEMPEILNRIRRGERVHHFETVRRHKDGSLVDISLTVSPILGPSGEIIGASKIARDIRERKQIEAQQRLLLDELQQAVQAKEVLLYEVNHRVKNSLLLVTSILALQGRQTKDPELRRFLSEARRRVEVVAQVHQRLYTSGQHTRVELASFLRDLATDTVSALDPDDRIALDLALEDETSLRLDRAVPLALVVSELVTNAMKYAFPGRERGAIKIALDKAGAESTRIVIADSGKGLPEGFDPARSNGLGMRIVMALLRQIRATLEVERHGPGACFQIVVPTEA